MCRLAPKREKTHKTDYKTEWQNTQNGQNGIVLFEGSARSIYLLLARVALNQGDIDKVSEYALQGLAANGVDKRVNLALQLKLEILNSESFMGSLVKVC